MYDPNNARKKNLEMIKKAEQELQHKFDKRGFNYKWIHKNGTKKDEHGKTREYYEIMEKYENLFENGKIQRENTKITDVKNERFTWCYKCYKPINNLYMVECTKCWWIICSSCWSCGCGYRDNVVGNDKQVKWKNTKNTKNTIHYVDININPQRLKPRGYNWYDVANKATDEDDDKEIRKYRYEK